MTIAIKYFALMISSQYVFVKLLNLKSLNKLRTIVACVLFSALTSGLMYFLRTYAASMSIMMMVSMMVLFVFLNFKTGLRISITASVISFALSYAAFFISAVIVAFLIVALERAANIAISQELETLIIGLIQILILAIPFRFKRLQNGMPFLMQHGNADIGVFVSGSLLISVSFLGANDDLDPIYVLPVFFILVAALILWFWWRNRISGQYMEKLKAREVHELESALSVRDETIEQLQRQNDEMAKIIHRDNKLIPAMELAVKELLRSGELIEDGAREGKAKALLAQLEQSLNERRGVLDDYERENHRLSTTGVDGIDNILSYMDKKAAAQHISLELSLNGDMKELTKRHISEKDACTLLADLLENALIASKGSEEGRILVFMGLKNSTYAIDVFDCGEDFSAHTLASFGLNPASTHLDDGGSGLGLLAIYEIAQRAGASIEIEEMGKGGLYTKRVSVVFDGQSEYRIASLRAKELSGVINRPDAVLSAP